MITSLFEPLFPTYNIAELENLSGELIRRTNALGGNINNVTKRALAELLAIMNSYYSNLIEGRNTHFKDVEEALKNNYSYDPAKRGLQLESVAHIKVQLGIDKILDTDYIFDICTIDFITWIHKQFYETLPEEFRKIKKPDGKIIILIPGKLRDEEVVIGKHVPPEPAEIKYFLERFTNFYKTDKFNDLHKVIAAAASHHRLAWIHPFIDGNGRVARLFTHAYMKKIGAGGSSLYSVSRGLARKKTDYMNYLELADRTRTNDLDGRGNLSDKYLSEFAKFVLEISIDQVKYMEGLLGINSILPRIKRYVEDRAAIKELRVEAFYILEKVFLVGEISRGEALKVTGKPERTARRILKSLLDKELLKSDSPKGPVRINFPSEAVEFYFPALYG